MSDTNLNTGENTGLDTGIATLGTTVIDCADALALAEFYSKVCGWPVDATSEPSWAQLDNPAGGATIAFQRVEGDFNPPVWPGLEHPQQFHLDFFVPDLDEAEGRVLGVGATKADFQPGTSFRVFLDPAGHPFCLCQD